MNRQWAATTALALALAVAGVQAQAQTVIGGGKKPDVEVDFGVLGRVGPEPTLPNVLNPRVPPSSQAATERDPGIITLKPPASVRHSAQTPKPSAKTAKTVKAEPHKTAEKKGVDKKALAAVKTRHTSTDSVADAASSTAKPSKAVRTVSNRPPPRPPVSPERKPAIEVNEIDATPVKAVEAIKPVIETAAAAPQALVPQIAVPQVAPPAPVPQSTAVESKPVSGPPPIEAPSLQSKPAAVAPPPLPAAQPVQTAAVTPAARPAPGHVIAKDDAVSVIFTDGGATLPDMAKQELLRLSQRLDQDQALHLQLLAYAEGDEASASKARRLSLSRALAVRSYLMDQGVRSTRIEVRALGNKAGDGPGDRVDISLARR